MDTSRVKNMSYMFGYIGNSNNNLILDLSSFNFDSVTSYTNMFEGGKTTNKVYVKNSTDQAWVIARNNSAFSTSNVLIKQ